MKLRLLTMNVHKGFSALGRRFVLPRLKQAIHTADADIVFLQEVVGENIKKAAKHPEWPAQAQHEYIAEGSALAHIYGKNAVYAAGHHGNAILSRYPMEVFERVDVSTNRFEQRGILYCLLKPPRGPALHCVCVHLGLFARSRRKQFRLLRSYIEEHVPAGAPLIVAGDFNEWRKGKKDELETGLGMTDAGLAVSGRKVRTFPALLPVFPLDRVYLRGLKAVSARILHTGIWKNLSDHAAFCAEAELP
jgi:endonuclease/exonuclease/phosphatase family metal-dependent hydrolase